MIPVIFMVQMYSTNLKFVKKFANANEFTLQNFLYNAKINHQAGEILNEFKNQNHHMD